MARSFVVIGYCRADCCYHVGASVVTSNAAVSGNTVLSRGESMPWVCRPVMRLPLALPPMQMRRLGEANNFAADRWQICWRRYSLGKVECDQKAGAKRVIRGGSWNNKARNCRSAYRNWNHPDKRNNNLGFRPARAHDRVG
ncbi:MAG: hypothetical protein DIZ78_12275 [endosymbiont of Escarpia spicata]|uniref:Sulfatase-modifying factor enzyme-like domain-containing protein n=1 Tax=endosymbiont of Escarpia spicata TaxID=2200908 RepID=A0A370DJP0_9GAMM|nr:MAG: hypothetical protein DIZ78_12275 [endosymbiont of Escarpia spicata]